MSEPMDYVAVPEDFSKYASIARDWGTIPLHTLTREEFYAGMIHSPSAISQKLDNRFEDVQILNNVKEFFAYLIDTFTLLGLAKETLYISSGYRSPKVNKAVGGSETSAHRSGYAIDIVRVGGQRCNTIHDEIISGIVKFDQIKLAKDLSYVHFGYKSPKGEQRMMVLDHNNNVIKTVVHIEKQVEKQIESRKDIIVKEIHALVDELKEI
jgi:hypothetical protein